MSSIPDAYDRMAQQIRELGGNPPAKPADDVQVRGSGTGPEQAVTVEVINGLVTSLDIDQYWLTQNPHHRFVTELKSALNQALTEHNERQLEELSKHDVGFANLNKLLTETQRDLEHAFNQHFSNVRARSEEIR
ncbi:hypothetical protein [Parenemella sanctibonifatiensis]|uniref:Uncharacterized protein n=1 Tax=Parenemella sanctibonifatiensis TaxID=2016505 RepID=A0A255EJ73_9ACTN|nr:hypothetical protein [Parenemella sanctibonifatiensis]OYN91031.1 hypothetical protein CGZ91_06060 [Parenemella sanctibonifatiensis]